MPTLLDNYRRRQKAVRRRSTELDQMRAAVLSAAENEALAIVAQARSGIGRIIVDSRRKLLELSKQVDAIPNSVAGWPEHRSGEAPSDGNSSVPLFPDEDSVELSDDVLHVRRHMNRLVDEVRPELDRLGEKPLEFDRVVETPVGDRPLPVDDPPSPVEDRPRPARAVARIAVEPTIDEPPAAREPVVEQQRRRAPALRGALIAVVGVMLPLVVLWSRFERGASEAPSSPVAQKVPPPAAAHAAKPAFEPIGTNGRTPTPEVPAAMTAAVKPSPVRPSATAVPLAPLEATNRRGAAAAPAPSPLAAVVPAPSNETATERGIELATAAERWLDAYYRHDTTRLAAMGSENLEISDKRGEGEKPPAGLDNLRRALDQIKLQSVGDSTVLTARMTERTDGAGSPRQYLSRISQVWLRDAEGWRLMEVRIINDAILR